MNRFCTTFFLALLPLTASLLYIDCHSQSTLSAGKSAGESHSPSKVEKVPVETEIARITLTPEATRRLGITTADVTLKDATRRRTFGGDITIPSGKSIIVAAPFSGAIVPPQLLQMLNLPRRVNFIEFLQRADSETTTRCRFPAVQYQIGADSD